MDTAIAKLSKPSMARVCIQMDLMKTFPNIIWIDSGISGFWQEALYEKILKYCTLCSKQCHDKVACKFGEFKNVEYVAAISDDQLKIWFPKQQQNIVANQSEVVDHGNYWCENLK